MEKTMCEKVVEAIEKEKIIVIVRNVEKEKLLPLSKAMYDGGIRLLEVTYSASGKTPDETVAESIGMLVKKFGGDMFIGAGTVLTERQVELTAKVGGSFIISPDTCEDVIKETKRLGLVSIPGAFTPSEIQSAHRAGADLVKLFPISSLGAAYIKAVKGPLDNIKLLAVGGVDETVMREYLAAGVSGFGVGSNIIDKKALKENDWQAITALAKKYTEILK